jgi:6,7-dimethyl-8-ribityllumazine synthase
MLTKVSQSKIKAGAESARFVIVASRYNPRFVNAMLKAAQDELDEAGAGSVEVIRVPGAYEIPVVAARVARVYQDQPCAIICLGVILRGATLHARLIAEAVTAALVEVQVRREVPVIHEVLLLENTEQARERCLDPDHNRGREAARTALEMVRVLRAWKGRERRPEPVSEDRAK